MTPKQKEFLVANIKQSLKVNGWVEDRWGNFKRAVSGKEYRVKFQKTSIRYELKVGKDWLNIVSDYIKNVVVSEGSFVIKGSIIQ